MKIYIESRDITYFNHGSRGERRILTYMIQSLVESNHDIYIPTSKTKWEDNIPGNLYLNSDPSRSDYEAIICIDGRRCIEKYSENIPIFNFAMSKRRGPLYYKCKTKDTYYCVGHENRKRRDNIFIPFPAVPTISENNNLTKNSLIFTARRGFLLQREKYIPILKQALEDANLEHIYIMSGMDTVSSTQAINQTKKAIKSCMNHKHSNKIVIFPNIPQEEFNQQLGESSYSVAFHNISGSHLRAIGCGCLPFISKGHLLRNSCENFFRKKNIDKTFLIPKNAYKQYIFFRKRPKLYNELLSIYKEQVKLYTFKSFVKHLEKQIRLKGKLDE